MHTYYIFKCFLVFSITQMLVKCFENYGTWKKQKMENVVFNGTIYNGVNEKEVFYTYWKISNMKERHQN